MSCLIVFSSLEIVSFSPPFSIAVCIRVDVVVGVFTFSFCCIVFTLTMANSFCTVSNSLTK
ncbi:unnamed protein product [Schistosoma margrebowiei]|uniref:Uncharacterized protein n=1 Tax=Schistosoma margrebowiei TaxID=48269 RepID=A0A3P8BX94_9TREM|nr:unnamed protein product [Schistosoma margrebowiei]